MSREEACASFQLDSARKVVGLFPGSRKSEIERILPAILASAALLQQRFPDLQFVLPVASTLADSEILPRIAASGIAVAVTRDRIHDLIRACDAVISVSGTVTLEIALVGTPLVIIYKLSPITYQAAKHLVKVEHIGLCNIVAGETVVKELIQDEATPEKIAAEIGKIIEIEPYAAGIRQKLSAVRAQLKSGGASANVAQLALSLMDFP